MGVTAAIAAVGSLAVGIGSYETQKGLASQLEGEGATVFGEQQYYAEQLNKLIANPSSVTSLPGYQFNLQTGEQSVARQFGPQAGSGAEGVALTQYGENYANSAYQTQ